MLTPQMIVFMIICGDLKLKAGKERRNFFKITKTINRLSFSPKTINRNLDDTIKVKLFVKGI